MLFRIGIHLGDVLVHPDGRVFGDGVNVAARLQAFAEPGGICVSEMVHAAVGNKVPAVFDALGEQQFCRILNPAPGTWSILAVHLLNSGSTAQVTATLIGR